MSERVIQEKKRVSDIFDPNFVIQTFNAIANRLISS